MLGPKITFSLYVDFVSIMLGLKLPGHQGVSSGISSAYNTGSHETNATGGKFPSKVC